MRSAVAAMSRELVSVVRTRIAVREKSAVTTVEKLRGLEFTSSITAEYCARFSQSVVFSTAAGVSTILPSGEIRMSPLGFCEPRSRSSR
jgi:hypothetical protein